MPSQKTVVSVTVTKAINDKRAEVKSLEGSIGTITLDPTEPVAAKDLPFEQKILSWWHSAFTSVTNWRLNTAAYCQSQKKLYELQTGVTFQPTAGKDLLPLSDSPSTSSTTTSTSALGPHENAHDYYNLIWTSACSTLFGNELVFYIVGIVLVFLILRFTIGKLL